MVMLAEKLFQPNYAPPRDFGGPPADEAIDFDEINDRVDLLRRINAFYGREVSPQEINVTTIKVPPEVKSIIQQSDIPVITVGRPPIVSCYEMTPGNIAEGGDAFQIIARPKSAGSYSYSTALRNRLKRRDDDGSFYYLGSDGEPYYFGLADYRNTVGAFVLIHDFGDISFQAFPTTIHRNYMGMFDLDGTLKPDEPPKEEGPTALLLTAIGRTMREAGVPWEGEVTRNNLHFPGMTLSAEARRIFKPSHAVGGRLPFMVVGQREEIQPKGEIELDIIYIEVGRDRWPGSPFLTINLGGKQPVCNLFAKTIPLQIEQSVDPNVVSLRRHWDYMPTFVQSAPSYSYYLGYPTKTEERMLLIVITKPHDVHLLSLELPKGTLAQALIQPEEPVVPQVRQVEEAAPAPTETVLPSPEASSPPKTWDDLTRLISAFPYLNKIVEGLELPPYSYIGHFPRSGTDLIINPHTVEVGGNRTVTEIGVFVSGLLQNQLARWRSNPPAEATDIVDGLSTNGPDQLRITLHPGRNGEIAIKSAVILKRRRDKYKEIFYTEEKVPFFTDPVMASTIISLAAKRQRRDTKTSATARNTRW
jgi:hypothetical protein